VFQVQQVGLGHLGDDSEVGEVAVADVDDAGAVDIAVDARENTVGLSLLEAVSLLLSGGTSVVDGQASGDGGADESLVGLIFLSGHLVEADVGDASLVNVAIDTGEDAELLSLLEAEGLLGGGGASVVKSKSSIETGGDDTFVDLVVDGLFGGLVAGSSSLEADVGDASAVHVAVDTGEDTVFLGLLGAVGGDLGIGALSLNKDVGGGASGVANQASGCDGSNKSGGESLHNFNYYYIITYLNAF